jgi:hypothetical protein
VISKQHWEAPLFGLPATTDPALKLGLFFEVTFTFYYSACTMSTGNSRISICQKGDNGLDGVKRIQGPIFRSKEEAEQHGQQLCKDWIDKQP